MLRLISKKELSSLQVQIDRIVAAQELLQSIGEKLVDYKEKIKRENSIAKEALASNVDILNKRNDALIKYLMEYKKVVK